MSKVNQLHNLKRPAIERMLRIHGALKRGNFPNCSMLARELEVSSKTISRDIDFMRDRMLLPIEYEASKHGFYYSREVESMPTIDISEGELLALSMARKSLDLYKGTPFEKPLENALNKLAASLPETITANLSQLSESISFRQGRLSQIDESVLHLATQAVLERKSISFRYKKPGFDKAEHRTADPYHITNYLGKWYLIGRDHGREAVRTFLLTRASDASVTNLTFSIPNEFTPEEYLWSSFGIYAPTGKYNVEIEFSKSIAEYISENIWHPTQESKLKDDGSLVLSFRLGSLVEIAQWILSWGNRAKVIRPKSLIEQVRRYAESIAALYN